MTWDNEWCGVSMNTGSAEAIRIAKKYLPGASWERQKELALEIVGAIELCEAELAKEITRRFEALAART